MPGEVILKMPKRATHTYESEKDGLKDSELGVCYCMCCGESNLILGPGAALASLPRRKTDGAYALEKGKVVFKLKTVRGETKLLRREKGFFERQFRFECWNCKICCGYTCVATQSQAPPTHPLCPSLPTCAGTRPTHPDARRARMQSSRTSCPRQWARSRTCT